jgi:hypothetical protein
VLLKTYPFACNEGYVGDDHPTELPLRLDNVAMTFENTEHYKTAGPFAWLEWQSLNHFPKSFGSVHLGPNGKSLFPSMRIPGFTCFSPT